MRKLVFLLVFCMLVGCHGKSSKNAKLNNGVIEIDLSKIDLKEKSKPRELAIQEIADVEYIPMETRSDVLLDGGGLHQIFMSDSLIVTANRDGSIFVFNRQGKNLNVFNHKGRGAEEYQTINFMSVGFDPQEIYINDSQQKQKIKVYAFDGTFKRDLHLPANYEIAQFYVYDRESLIAVDNYDIDIAHQSNIAENRYPYALISKKDGEIRPLSLAFQVRVPDGLYLPEMRGEMGWGVVPFIRNGEECLIADFALDTIYCLLEGGGLLPLFVKHPAKMWESTPQKMFCLSLNAPRYAFFEFFEKQFPSGGYKKMVYDRHTGEFYEYCFVNRDYQDRKIVFPGQAFCHLPSRYARFKLTTSQLLKDYEEGKLTGKLKEVASRLNEDDNDVLVLVKFKE